MVRQNEAPRDSIDSTRPQMSDLVPADGSLFRPSHARQPSNPNVFSDDHSIDSIDAPLFSNHQRNHSFSSFDSTSTVEPRDYDTSKPLAENSTRVNLMDQQLNRRSLASVHQRDESLTLGRTVSRQSHASCASVDDLNPFADQPNPSFAESARPSSIRKGITTLNRQSTVSTTSTRSGYTAVPRAMSPYRGATTGPSHPYAMYPQVGVGRSPSVATVSTIRHADSPLRRPTGPQHPYGMYPQNIEYEEDLGDQPIPVGFPPRGLQPQGATTRADDVGDIIGPDGHLEQLPPYSRYPDGVIRPTISRGPASIASDMRGRWERYQDEPHTRSDSSSGTGTLINVDSSEPLRSPTTSSGRSSTLVAPVPLEEKSRQKGQKKCCGAPIWLVVMSSMTMVICALLGGVIGGVLGERAVEHRAQLAAAKHSSHPASVVTVTYTSDVSPYTSTPTGIAALPTGSYQIPWTVTNVSKFCIGTSKPQSWNCQIMDPLPVDIQGSIMSSSLKVKQPSIKDGQFNYGAQLPYDINPLQQQLSIMIDKEDPQLGPALFFQTMFNKLVIVQDSQDMQSKRSLDERDTNGFVNGQNQNTNYPKPWFCWWNQTQFEAFIYINQTQDATGSGPYSTTSSTIQPAPITSAPSPGPTAGSQKRDLDLILRDSITGNYPRKVKIKENRVNPSAPHAYCQQMQVNPDNSITPIVGQRFDINETVPTGQHGGPVPCYCEWIT